MVKRRKPSRDSSRPKKSKKKGKRKFKYQRRSHEEIEARANRRSGSWETPFQNKFKVWIPQDGVNKIRFLPPTGDVKGHYGIDVWLHSQIGPDKSKYMCPKKMNEGPCAVCDEMMAATRRNESEDYIKELKPYCQVLTWIIVRKGEEEGPQLFCCAFGLDKDIAAASIDQDTNEQLDIEDPYDGYDVSFRKEGKKGGFPSYGGVVVSRRVTPASDDDDELADWLDYITDHPLTSVLEYHNYDHVQANFEGTADPDDDDEDEDDDEELRTRSRRDEDEDDWDDEDEDEEEDEDDEEDDDDDRPRSRRRRVEVDDDEEEEDEEEEDEDDDEEEEEEEEDPKPRRSTKRGRGRSSSKSESRGKEKKTKKTKKRKRRR